MTKPTKQQVIEALLNDPKSCFTEGAATIASEALIRAGLVGGGPKEKGEYWVKWKEGDKWRKAWFCGFSWYPENKYVASETMAWLSYAICKPPAIIGPRITPPSEDK